MEIEELKCTNPSFSDMFDGEKSFDIRKNDRPYRKGILLWQREYDKITGYSGRDMIQFVSYILVAGTYPGLEPGYCNMGVITLQKREAGSTVPLLELKKHG